MCATTGDVRQGLVSADAMGQLEQFAQRTFAEETGRTTGGAAGWQDPPEIRLEKVIVMNPIAALPAAASTPIRAERNASGRPSRERLMLGLHGRDRGGEG